MCASQFDIAMKRFITSLILIAICCISFAQHDMTPVDWKEIKNQVKKDPQRVNELVAALATPEMYGSLSLEDCILGFYGQSILVKNAGRDKSDEASRLYKQGEYEKALAAAGEALEKNPLNIRALEKSAYCIIALMEAGDTAYTDSDLELYVMREVKLLSIIAKTGDGSEEYPFCVTNVDDEYDFMRTYLRLSRFGGQALVGTCDVITIAEQSEYYKADKIYFDATRPLEIMEELFRF